MNKRYSISRGFLIFWTLFIGLGAVAGAIGMLSDPTGKALGMDAMLPYFQVLPFADTLFQDFIFSGIMLLLVNGITNLISAGLLFAKRKSGIITGMIFGITLMLWIIIQFVILPANFMSTIYFIFGFLQFITGYICLVGYEQSEFTFDEKEYENIGKNNTKAVVYFSRCGYTKKLAYQIANEQGAEIIEIQTTERTGGTLGFWWCGRFGMHKWGMPLKDSDFDPSKYEEITICSPVWVFGICAPIREFCKTYNGKIGNVSYAITHSMSSKFDNIAEEMDMLLAAKHTSFKSFRCRFGKLKEIH